MTRHTSVKKTRLMPADHWDWSIPVSFSQGWRVDDLVFVGGQISFAPDGKVIGPGDIEAQTRKTFDYIRRVLHEGGADDPDLVKLNTWYGFEGEGAELKEYRERMTRVELEYLAGSGPVDTAVRIAGLATGAILVEIDAIAACGGEKVRLMPPGHRDWSMPGSRSLSLSLSEGWRVGDLVFVGGQVSMDAQGVAIAPGDVVTQTRNAYDRVGRVLEAAGAAFEDLVQVNIFYRYDGPQEEIGAYTDQIHAVSAEYLKAPHPTGSTIRVNGLAYEGLLVEIEAIAAVGGNNRPVEPADAWRWPGPRPFSQGMVAGGLIFVSGQLSLDGHGRVVDADDIAAQTDNVFTRIREVLNAAGADMGDLVKLYTLYHCDPRRHALREYWEDMTRVRMRHLPAPGPVGTAIRVNGFAQEGLAIEVQAIAARAD